eukprot:Gb_12597 [translate_table: standard]
MPKDLHACNYLVSRKAGRSCHHPYNDSGKVISDGNASVDVELDAQKKEWDNAMCLICLEHPHNAVLLLCSSYDKGCRPFMCNTSSRHSNCLDQYRKQRANCRNRPSQGEVYMDHLGGEVFGSRSHINLDDVASLGELGHVRRVFSQSWMPTSGESQVAQNRRGFHGLSQLHLDSRRERVRGSTVGEGEMSLNNLRPLRNGTEVLENESVELKCPLCRGAVKGWKVLEAARKYLNTKARSCSHELCSFSGTYEELRRHARSVHPTARPADVDPVRQRAWQDLEISRDFDDMLSTIHVNMPSAIVLRDYVINNEDGINPAQAEESDTLSTSRSWWVRFFLFHMLSPIVPFTDGRGLSARWRATRRQYIPAGTLSGQSILWGRNLLGAGNEDSDNVSAIWAVNGAAGPRRRHSNWFRPDGLP